MQNLKTLILPAFVLGAGLSAVLMRHRRCAMLEVLRADYVRTARAKGLFPRTVILKQMISRVVDALLSCPFLVLAIRHEDYLEGARAIGLPDRWIILRYVLPNVLSPLVVQATLTIASAILAEASLSFLGLGQQPPSPSWGSMLNTAKNFMEQAPWMSIAPGVAIYITVLCFNLLGDGLRDALDPKH